MEQRCFTRSKYGALPLLGWEARPDDRRRSEGALVGRGQWRADREPHCGRDAHVIQPGRSVFFYTAGGTTLRAWDSATGNALGPALNSPAEITALEVSHDGTTVWTLGSDSRR
jgi:hypothetical protein